METTLSLSVGITTRNRRESLNRCLASLAVLSGSAIEVMVLDDCSDPPVNVAEVQALSPGLPIAVIRHPSNLGYIAGRNRLVESAKSDSVLLLDDDTRLTCAESVWTAVTMLRSNRAHAAIAFAQLDNEEKPWPDAMQPAPVHHPCWTPTFIGFAHLLRRSTFLELGGYREILHYYGEEKEYCLRLLDAGHKVVFLPRCGIVHHPDPGGRDQIRYYRYYTRNDCLNALLNFPWPLAAGLVATRLARYHETLWRHLRLRDARGRLWVLQQLKDAWPIVAKTRRAVGWRTILLWQRLKRDHPPSPTSADNTSGSPPESA